MFAQKPLVVSRMSNEQQKKRLKRDLKKILFRKNSAGKPFINQEKIANDAVVKQYEVSRSLREQLAVKNQSFKKLCNYAENLLEKPLARIPNEIQVAYTQYKNLGGKPSRITKVIDILTNERAS